MAPHWNSRARGAYVGLRHFHGRPHLVRAAIEGVCQQLALALASIREAGHEVREIRAMGGFARRRAAAPNVDRPARHAGGIPRRPRGSAYGAALLGMQALDMIDSIDQAADHLRIKQTLEPDPETAAAYAGLLPLSAELYDDLTPAFRALARLGVAAPRG